MKRSVKILLATTSVMVSIMLAGSSQAFGQVNTTSLKSIINDPFRTEISRSRDQFRHPQETLEFFGVEPNMTVVELWPSGGWYTDILAPYLKDEGKYIAAHYNPETDHPYASFFQSAYLAFETKIDNDPDWYGQVDIHGFEPPFTKPMVADGSADMVLSFRNMQSWLNDGSIDFVLEQVRAMLKPGGTFGIVDNRADVYENPDPLAENGYINQQWLVQKIHEAGFQSLDYSEINANRLDTADHPNGVWNLPPYLQVAEGEDTEKYLAIGESDRFTIKFIKLGK